MEDGVKKIIRKLVPKRLVNFLAYTLETDFEKTSYSLHGEDLMIAAFLQKKQSGTYLDIGSNHPVRHSNTYYFYKKGWRGLCIDPLETYIELYKQLRPEDKLATGAVGRAGKLTYYQFEQNAYNTLDAAKASSVESALVDETTIQVSTLKDVLTGFYPDGKHFEFVSIDVEGSELEILESNDWKKFSFEYILIESLKMRRSDSPKPPLQTYLESLGYRLVGMNLKNLLFSKS